jgi:hypothetical protein
MKAQIDRAVHQLGRRGGRENLDVFASTMRHSAAQPLVDLHTVEGREDLGSSIAPLRHALRALASECDFFQAPHEAIARLRPQVDRERRRARQDLAIVGSRDKGLDGWTRLADGAVIGLSHLARLHVATATHSVVAPFSLVAVGKYGARCCGPDAVLELQYLLPEDAESWKRSGGIIAFMRLGLAELGLSDFHDSVASAYESARLAHNDSVVAARLATARFLSGQYGLHATFVDMLRSSGSAESL